MPESVKTRDAAQRRLLVSLADSAPLSPRRPRAFAAVAVFALSGVLAGAATTAAVALTAEARMGPAVTYVAPSSEQIAATVPGDTRLLGEPFIVERAIGSTSLDVGGAPEGATELYIAFRCLGPGAATVSLDGTALATSSCEGAGGGFGGGESVDGSGPHTVSVSGSGSYLLWASWSAPAVLPEPSPEQNAALEDGTVTHTEYRAGFDRYARCLADAGHPVDVLGEEEGVIRYANSEASVHSGAEGRCYAREFALIDPAWQGAQQ
jgi:hypothetical protein